MKRFGQYLLLCAITAFAAVQSVSAQDFAREKRWADEVVPALVVGEAVMLKNSAGREFLGLYTETKGAKTALVIVHGVGVHPDHGVIGVIRAKLADKGYSTLSIQMPVQAKEAKLEDYYPTVFPEAIDRIGRAAEWLSARNYARIAIASHSMGAWMANEYFDLHHTATPYKAWVSMGLTGGYSWGMRRYAFPILDVYGENDLPPNLSAAWRRKWALSPGNGSRQAMIAGADHFYAQKEGELVDVIDRFLRDTGNAP